MVNHDGQVQSNQPAAAEILEMICSMNYEFISSHGGCGWLAGWTLPFSQVVECWAGDQYARDCYFSLQVAGVCVAENVRVIYHNKQLVVNI